MKYEPKHLAVMYDCLRQLPPFDKWNLPGSEWVVFELPHRKDVMGEFIESTDATKPHKIKISAVVHDHTFNVVQTLAHEMLHLVQTIQKTSTPAQHNQDFRKRAKLVCRLHGWDHKFFTGG